MAKSMRSKIKRKFRYVHPPHTHTSMSPAPAPATATPSFIYVVLPAASKVFFHFGLYHVLCLVYPQLFRD